MTCLSIISFCGDWNLWQRHKEWFGAVVPWTATASLSVSALSCVYEGFQCQSCCSSAGSHMALEGGCCLGRQLMQRGGCWGSLRFPLTSAKSHHCQWTTCLTHEGSAFCFFPKWVYTCSERKKPHFPLQHWELGEPPGLRGTQAWCSLLGIHFLLLL